MIYLEEVDIMNKDEYVTTAIYNGRMINIWLDYYGQTYFLEYLEDNELKEECVGPYITDCVNYIEWRFGEPEINCPIYHDVITSDIECCTNQNKSFCSKCRKSWNDIDYAALQKRQKELEEILKSKQ